MAKRFIDTDLFKDGWFESLSNDAKVFWLYYITNCDHAGLLKYTKRQIAFYCNLSSVDAVFAEFGERLVYVKEDLLWMPKFFRYQYGNWPENNFAAANSAYYSLTKLQIDLDSHITVPRELKDSLSKGIGIGKGKGDSKGKGKKESESEKIDETLKNW